MEINEHNEHHEHRDIQTDNNQPRDTERVQSALRSRPATKDDLFKKKRRESTVTLPTTDDAGNLIELQLRFRAIGSVEYDDLVAKHKPTPQQAKDGAAYNVDTFAPALISAVSLDPSLSVEDATALYQSPDWSGGEVSGLFIGALRLCNAGLDVPFTEAG